MNGYLSGSKKCYSWGRGFNLSEHDTINDYINKQTGDDIVKLSLKKQSNLYTIIDNMAEKNCLKRRAITTIKNIKTFKKSSWRLWSCRWSYLVGGGGTGF